MCKKLMQNIRKIRKDNKGSAIVLVIVALAMVGILAMTIMWMSMTNYYMKATDKGNKQGFYSAETVLEQIKAGLEEDASWAAARAYAYILTKDYSASSLADRDYEFKKAYQDYFVQRVVDPSDATKSTYSISHLLEYVDSSLGVTNSAPTPTTTMIRYLDSPTCSFIHSYSSDLMKLEAVHLEYTEDSANAGEFYSVIDTDIIIMVPDVSFTQTSVLPDVFEYALVADKKIVDTNSGTGETVDGNIYAGEDGIELLNKLTVKYSEQSSGRLVSKGNVKIGTDAMSISGAELNVEGPTSGMSEFWAEDITLGKSAMLTTNRVDSFVADDLTLSGRKAKVKMEGNGSYYGYGKSESKASESSAIVVNGLGSQVDIKGLDKVVLLGRTFVSIPQLEPVPGGVSVNSTDFRMGESLAVKGEQVAFLVPDECLTYQDDAVSENAVKMTNPFSSTVYPDNTKIKVNLSALSEYVEPTGYKIVRPYGSKLGYVYMQMTGDKANEYYEEYYKRNLEKLNNYFLVYTGAGKVELPAGSKISSEGNFLSAVISDNSIPSDKIIRNTDSQLYISVPESDKEYINADLTKKKKNLCAKLITDGATAAELSNTLFDNIISREDVENLISLNHQNPYTFVGTTDGNTYKAVFAKAAPGTPYNYTDTSIRVLVVIGDVNINANFTGLLIASGTVKINGGYTITSIINADDTQMQALKDALQVKQTVQYKNLADPTPVETTEDRSALQYFVDGTEYDLDGLQRNGSPTVSKNNVEFTELVKFNNWIKK